MSSEDLLKATWDMDERTVEKCIDMIHVEHTSILSYHDELHQFTTF